MLNYIYWVVTLLKRMIVQFKSCNTTKSRFKSQNQTTKRFFIEFFTEFVVFMLFVIITILSRNFSLNVTLHGRFIMIFFHMAGKTWRCLAIIYALLHYFLPCKENLCWKPHLFYCSIKEVSFSYYNIYAWTDYRKIIKKSGHIKNNP